MTSRISPASSFAVTIPSRWPPLDVRRGDHGRAAVVGCSAGGHRRWPRGRGRRLGQRLGGRASGTAAAHVPPRRVARQREPRGARHARAVARRRCRRVARGSLHLPADGFVEQANDQLPGLPLVGGLASSGGGAGATRLFRDGRSSNRGAVGVVLSTTPDTQHPVAVSTIVSQGTRPIGPAMTVTRG